MLYVEPVTLSIDTCYCASILGTATGHSKSERYELPGQEWRRRKEDVNNVDGTGARVYEAINLRVSDINLQHKIMSLRRPEGEQRRILPISCALRNTLDLYLQSSARERGGSDLVFVTRDGRRLRRNTLRYNFVRICARARIHQEHGYSPTPGMHDLRHTFAVHVLETWVREGKDLRQKLPLLSGYMGHALLKSTELYLRLVPDRFVKPLSRLQEPPNRKK